MALENLNEKLHGRDIHFDRGLHTSYDPEDAVADPNAAAEFKKTEAWQAPVVDKPLSSPELILVEAASRKRRKWIAIALGSVAVLLLIGGIVYKVHGMLFDESRVTLSISGPQDVASAEETTFTILYANKNWGGLTDAVLTLSYPESFHLQAGNDAEINGSLAKIPLGDIKASADGKILIKGKFYGSRGDLVSLKVTLRYKPNNVSTVFEKSTEFSVNVASSPLLLEITAPLELATGQDVEYVIDYRNASDVPFSNLRVKMDYPEGFQSVSAEPKASEGDSVWYVGNLAARQSGKIIIRGMLSGANQEQKRVHGMIGFFQGEGKFVAYAENERQTRIIASPLSIAQVVNGLTAISVNAGDRLEYSVHYRNDGDIGLRDVIINLFIDPTVLDMSRLSLSNGAYDAARKMLTWKASGVPALGKLSPGAEGEVTFSVPVMEKITVPGGKNISIKTVATIDSLDIPTPIGSNKIIGSNTLYVKLKSSVGINMVTVYTDTVIPNSGPIPPKVGIETSYTLHLSVTNSLNDTKQARLSFILPTGVRYTGKYAKPEESLTFNERSNELIWELGTLSATESQPREVIFQVATTPSPNQAGGALTLVNSSVFTAKDTFTDEDIRVEREKQYNSLTGDSVYNVDTKGDVSTVQPAD